MNPHFTLFRYAMTRPGDQPRSVRGVGVVAFFVGLAVVAAVAFPIIVG